MRSPKLNMSGGGAAPAKANAAASVTRSRRAIVVATLLTCALVALMLASLCTGSVPTTPADVAELLLGGGAETARRVLWEIRLPRVPHRHAPWWGALPLGL